MKKTMKIIETMRDGENLGWCKPYTTPDKKLWVIIGANNVSIKDGETVIYNATTEQIKEYAKKFNPDYAEYDGATDVQILLDGIYAQYLGQQGQHERGCTECPFRDVCDAVNEEIEQ